MGCQVRSPSCLHPSLDGNRSILTRVSRAVGFIDLGLLVIANFILHPRLPPNKKTGQGSLRKVLTDVPFLVFVLGTFLVRPHCNDMTEANLELKVLLGLLGCVRPMYVPDWTFYRVRPTGSHSTSLLSAAIRRGTRRPPRVLQICGVSWFWPPWITLKLLQITIMNAGSLFGRTIPNVVADYYGPLNGAL